MHLLVTRGRHSQAAAWLCQCVQRVASPDYAKPIAVRKHNAHQHIDCPGLWVPRQSPSPCKLPLQEEYRKDMTLKEAEVVALSTLKQVMEEKVRAQL